MLVKNPSKVTLVLNMIESTDGFRYTYQGALLLSEGKQANMLRCNIPLGENDS